MYLLNTNMYGNDKMQELLDFYKFQLSTLSKVYGVPFDSEKLTNLARETEIKIEQMLIGFNQAFGLPLDTRLRVTERKYSQFNIMNLIEKYYGVTNEYFQDHSGNQVSNKERLEEYKIILRDAGMTSELIDNVIELKRLLSLKGSFIKIYGAMSEYVQELGIDYTPKVFFARPSFEYGTTFRLSTNNPPIQGLQAELKECIGGLEGYDIITVDMKGQELNPLICEYTNIPGLKEIYMKTGDPYISMMRVLGCPETKLYRSLIKVPMLGIPRGQTRFGSFNKVNLEYDLSKDKAFADIISGVHDLIENDPVYKATIKEAVSTQKNSIRKYTKGVFGTIQVIEEKGPHWKMANKIKNGFLQITGAELIALSFTEFMRRIYTKYGDFSIARPLVTIHDEIVAIARKDVADEVENELIDCCTPKVNDWVRMQSECKRGDHYISK